MVVAFLAATQFALPMLQFKTLKNLPFALIATFVAGIFYGCSIELIVWIMKPMKLMQPYPLNILHILGIVILVLAWLSILFFKSLVMKDNVPLWVLRGYVFALNACQPHPKTVTTYRNQYKYE